MENRLVQICALFLRLALAIRPCLVFDTYLIVQTTASTPRFNQLGFNLFQEHDLRFGDRIKPKRIVVDIQQEETKGPSSMFASYSWFIHYMFIVVCTSSVSSCSFHEQHCGNNITRHSSIPIHSIHFPPWRRPKRFWRPVLFRWDDFSEKQMRLKMFLLRHILWKKRHGRPASVTNLTGRSSNSSNGDFGRGKVPFCFENSPVQRLSRGRHKMSPCWKCCVLLGRSFIVPQ